MVSFLPFYRWGNRGMEMCCNRSQVHMNWQSQDSNLQVSNVPGRLWHDTLCASERQVSSLKQRGLKPGFSKHQLKQPTMCHLPRWVLSPLPAHVGPMPGKAGSIPCALLMERRKNLSKTTQPVGGRGMIWTKANMPQRPRLSPSQPAPAASRIKIKRD
jgi:hypothetical protein